MHLRNTFAVLIVLLVLGSFVRIANAQVLINSSPYANWYIYDYNAFPQNKTQINDVIRVFDSAVPQLQSDFGGSIVPITVNINSGGCCGGSSGGGVEGLSIGDFNFNGVLCSPWLSAENWTEGVAIGEFVNTYTGSIANGWPRDWWADDVWYFPGISAIRGLSQGGYSNISTQWAATAATSCTAYDSHPIYNIFNNVLTNDGWTPFKVAFNNMTADGFDNYDDLTYPNGTAAPNPSALRSEYAIAFLSLKDNVSSAFVDDLNMNGGLTYKINQSVVNNILVAIKEIQSGKSMGLLMSGADAELDSGNYTGAYQTAQDEISSTSSSSISSSSSTSRSTSVSTSTIITQTTVKSTTTATASSTKSSSSSSLNSSVTSSAKTTSISNSSSAIIGSSNAARENQAVQNDLLIGLGVTVFIVIIAIIVWFRSRMPPKPKTPPPQVFTPPEPPNPSE